MYLGPKQTSDPNVCIYVIHQWPLGTVGEKEKVLEQVIVIQVRRDKCRLLE